jgi:hypothetical protein
MDILLENATVVTMDGTQPVLNNFLPIVGVTIRRKRCPIKRFGEVVFANLSAMR